VYKTKDEQKKHNFMFNYFFVENLAVYVTMRKNTEEPGRLHMTIRRMRTASWIRKATHAHPEYVTLIAF